MAAKMTEESSYIPIKITNLINPHVFHFKLESIIGQNDIEIEKRLKKIAKRNARLTGHSPELGEMVAAYIVTWDKWVRAQVEMILDNNQQYIVWCMDHGIPMKIPRQHLMVMPIEYKELKELPPSAFVGGLARCLPVEQKLDFAKMTYDVMDISDFPEFLITKAKQLIDESDEILFAPRQKMGEHIFGDIKITKFNGDQIDLVHELSKTGSIKKIDAYIPKGIERLFTTKKYRYENNLGNLNILPMKVDMKSIQSKDVKSAISVSSKNTDEEVKYIADWSKHNTVLAKKMEHDAKERFATIINNLPCYKPVENYPAMPFPNSHLFGSSISSFGSSHFDLLRASESSTSINSSSTATSMAASESTYTGKLVKNLDKMKALSINVAEPANNKPEPKKIVYIPSGYECDLPDFAKYNQIYK